MQSDIEFLRQLSTAGWLRIPWHWPPPGFLRTARPNAALPTAAAGAGGGTCTVGCAVHAARTQRLVGVPTGVSCGTVPREHVLVDRSLPGAQVVPTTAHTPTTALSDVIHRPRATKRSPWVLIHLTCAAALNSKRGRHTPHHITHHNGTERRHPHTGFSSPSRVQPRRTATVALTHRGSTGGWRRLGVGVLPQRPC